MATAGSRSRAALLGSWLLLVHGCATTPSPTPVARPAVSDVDADGWLDARDACPAAAEDLDGFRDDDGCPDDDDDADGVPDVRDECASAAEDRDGLEDDDGCPDDDVDRDRALDAADACPREAEVYNGFEDDDGCPDAAIVLMDGDRIVVLTRIRFVPRSARVLPEDASLVDDLVLALRSPDAPATIELRARTVAGEGARDGDLRVRALVRKLVGAGIASTGLAVLPTEPAAGDDETGPTIELRVPALPRTTP